MSRILNDKERAELLVKYKDDRMHDAPHNITDKTLIENYGNDAQKALLQKAGGGAAPAKQEPKAKELEAEAAKGSGDNTAYLDAFNQYVKLHDGKAPAKELTTEQLVEANNKRVEELKNVQAAPKQKEQTPAQKAPAKAAVKVEAENTVKGVDMVELYNTKTNETKSFSRFTWENYMKGKEKDWQLKPTEPEEVQGL